MFFVIPPTKIGNVYIVTYLVKRDCTHQHKGINRQCRNQWVSASATFGRPGSKSHAIYWSSFLHIGFWWYFGGIFAGICASTMGTLVADSEGVVDWDSTICRLHSQAITWFFPALCLHLVSLGMRTSWSHRATGGLFFFWYVEVIVEVCCCKRFWLSCAFVAHNAKI